MPNHSLSRKQLDKCQFSPKSICRPCLLKFQSLSCQVECYKTLSRVIALPENKLQKNAAGW